MTPAAIGFDIDHTLGIDNTLERVVGVELLAELARESGCAFDRAAALAGMDRALASFRSTSTTLEEALREMFAQVACQGSAFEAAVARFRRIALQRAPQFVQALPGARALPEALDRLGIPYALLTNGWSPLQEEKARLLGFTGSVFVSERIGVRKPCARAFQVLVEHFGVEPAQVWYVGDDPKADVEGARQAGLVSVWLDGDTTPYPAGRLQPDFRIQRLSELVPLLAQGRQGATPKRLI